MTDEPASGAPSALRPDGERPGRSRVLLLCVVVGLVGLSGVALTAATDRLDSALLFVGVPCLLALGVGLVRGRGGWGTVFQVVTVVLLLASALLQEAAVCVLLAAPLVYGVAALAYGLVRYGERERGSLLALPLLAVVALEGVVPGARVHPDQTATATRVLAPTCAELVTALDRGPRIAPDVDRGRLLHLFPYPTPTAADGTGLERGDTWRLAVAGGTLTTRVVARTARSVDFVVDGDTSRLERWVTVRFGRLAWAGTADGCRATMSIRYERHLDPSLYFGPLTSVFMDAGTEAFLAGLD